MATSDQAIASVQLGDRAVSDASTARRFPFPGTKTLLTILPMIGTAVGFMLNFEYNLMQGRRTHQQDLETQWQNVVQQTSTGDEQSAIRTAYEFESFVNTPYGVDARARISTALTVIRDDESDFNTILFDLLGDTTQSDEGQILYVDKQLSAQLKDLYQRSMAGKTTAQLPKDKSFKYFISNTNEFLKAPSEAQTLKQANETIDELDSVSKGLVNLWTGQLQEPKYFKVTGKTGATKVSPDGQDFRDLMFIDGDFQNVNFLHAGSMQGVQLFGNCLVDRSKLPPTADIECEAQ